MDSIKPKLGTGFGWLNITQFLGALNDNIFKLLLIIFLIGTGGSDTASNVTATAGAVFVIPFLLFTALAGKFADRFSKRNIIVWVKVAEIAVMSIGCVAFWFHSAFALYGVLFLMATHSAFFAPAKYGIVPELVRTEQLSRANGSLEAMTYLAIVIGTALGPFLSQMLNGSFVLAGVACVAVASLGFVLSLFVPQTHAVGVVRPASIFFIRDIWRTLCAIRRDRDLFLAVIASAYFLMMGGFIYSNLIPYGIKHLGLSEVQSGYLFVMAAIGIGLGSFWAGRLSGRNVEFGIVPLGAIGLTISSAGLGLLPGLYPTFALVILMGISAGLFVVPIYAFIQLRSPAGQRGEILAASTFLGWVGVLIASGLIYCFTNIWRLTAGQVFAVLGVMTLIPTIITIVLLPDFFVRFLFVLLTKLCYRIKLVGEENVPSNKSVMLVCNHVSWVDALIVGATQQRRVRFIMDRSFYDTWWLKPVCKLMKVIPISSDDPPKTIITSLKQARAAMDDGYIVCIFAEGMITRNGMMAQFKGGFEHIIKGSNYDIIPVYLGGAWGSIFSYCYGKPLSTIPKKFPYPISVYFGKALPADSSIEFIRQKVSELSCDYFNSLKSPKRSLSRLFIKAARKNWSKRCIADSTGKHLNYGQTLISAIALADKLCKQINQDEKIGILLPPSAAGAIANLAVTISGRVSVNLNYVTGQEARNFAIEQCGIKCIISSQTFLEKAGISSNLQGLVLMEDLADNIKKFKKFKTYVKARFLPLPLLTKGRYRYGDDLTTVIFSSGSSGTPKGIMLSHHNIISNIEALRMVIQIQANDNLCGVLPFFHSFGFNCSLWLPLISGVSVSYVANPLDGPAVGKSILENKSTIVFAPPTFLLNYLRRIKPEEFASLRLVAAGAEKLNVRLADAFEEKFGIRPLEGYGATELSPVVSLNIPDVQAGGVLQIGTKHDSVGHPLPGVAAKIVDIENNRPLPAGVEGLLLVKGPNVMLGYLNMQEKTADVLTDGWYNTGDIAKIDKDGFITITDRLSRFSKIGGEMVPHIGVEQVYLESLGTHEQIVAVTSVPDDHKGEELFVLYTPEAGTAEKLHDIIAKSQISNMWKPKRSNYIMIESMPTLGSGKIDVIQLRKIALSAKGRFNT